MWPEHKLTSFFRPGPQGVATIKHQGVSLVHGAEKLCRPKSQASHPQPCSALHVMTYTFDVIFIYLKIIVQTIILSSLEISERLANMDFVSTRQELTRLIVTALFGQRLGFYFTVVLRQPASSVSISCQAPRLGCCCFSSVTWEFSTLAACWNKRESFNFFKERGGSRRGGRKEGRKRKKKAKQKENHGLTTDDCRRSSWVGPRNLYF